MIDLDIEKLLSTTSGRRPAPRRRKSAPPPGPDTSTPIRAEIIAQEGKCVNCGVKWRLPTPMKPRIVYRNRDGSEHGIINGPLPPGVQFSSLPRRLAFLARQSYPFCLLCWSEEDAPIEKP